MTEEMMLPQVVQDKEIAKISNKAEEVLKEAQALEVTDAFGLEYGALLLSQIRGVIKKGEEKRLFFTKPLNDHVKTINNLFKTILAPYQKADEIIEGKIKEHRKIKREEAEKAQKEAEKKLRKIEEEKKEQEAKPEKTGMAEWLIPLKIIPSPPARSLIPPPLKQIKVDGEKIASSRMRWKPEILDVEKIPESYLRETAKTQTGKAALWSLLNRKVQEGEREIPGVKIFQDESFVF